MCLRDNERDEDLGCLGKMARGAPAISLIHIFHCFTSISASKTSATGIGIGQLGWKPSLRLEALLPIGRGEMFSSDFISPFSLLKHLWTLWRRGSGRCGLPSWGVERGQFLRLSTIGPANQCIACGAGLPGSYGLTPRVTRSATWTDRSCDRSATSYHCGCREIAPLKPSKSVERDAETGQWKSRSKQDTMTSSGEIASVANYFQDEGAEELK